MSPLNNGLAALHNRHVDQRAVLVGNGPSLNRMDLRFLKGEIVIGLNKIFLGIQRFGFYPKYHVVVNDKVIRQSTAEIKSLNCVKFISRRNGALIPKNGLTYHINTDNPPARFCTDITQGVHEGWTVIYVALQVAFFLGFREVVIIGLDHRFEYVGLPNETKIMEGPDPNHFSSDYFGHGQEWDNPDLPHSEESYRIARAEYEKCGRRIIDATVGGACTVFEKADYRELFNVGIQ